MKDALGKIAYGGAFVVVLPALLSLWAAGLDAVGVVAWRQPLPGWVGTGALLGGAALMAVSMIALWRHGAGLPMNAYPTTRLVSRSSYAYFSHPIYLGFTLCVAGTSVICDSSAGLWVVTPCVALAAAALVIGYEGPATRARLGIPVIAPQFGVPPASSVPANCSRKVCALLAVFIPWAGLYSLFALMPAPQGAVELRLAFEHRMPMQAWAVWIYTLAYPFSALAPLALLTLADLRRFVVCGWLITASGFFVMLFVPGVATYLPTDWRGSELSLEALNRAIDREWLAMPSFHVAWAFVGAQCFAARREEYAVPAHAFALLVALSAVLTGSHALVDVLAGVGSAYLCWHYDSCWKFFVTLAERLANSWAAMRVGKVRIISHAAWSAAAMTLGSLLAHYLAGPRYRADISVAGLIVLAGAGIWGYALEGGSRLSRPFGYFGSVIGVGFALAILAWVDGDRAAILAASLAAAAPLAHGLGRMRCLVQGCCHGRPLQGAYGIRIFSECSRVVALAGLRGVAIHPTPLYAIAANAVIALILLRLVSTGTASTFVAGAYLVLAAIARFAEEGYRGEPQTPHPFGLSLYQWLALIMLVCGAALSTVPGPQFQAAAEWSSASLAFAIALGLAAAMALSVDFPESNHRFSRLTVIDRQGGD